MARYGTLLVFLGVGPAAALNSGGRSFLDSRMQPEVVAHTLRNVEEEWKAQAALFAECSSTGKDKNSLVDCSDAPTSFAKSCTLVANAIVQGSTGDKSVAKEYMTDVCSQPSIKGWHQQKCQGLAFAIDGAMSADTYQNRYNFNTEKLCTGFWSRFLKEEETRTAEEKVVHEAAEKKAAEEDKVEREAEEKKAVEQAQLKKVEDAAHQKQEAELKAKESAENVERKKAEAAAVAKAAELKMAEAAQAEKEHKEAIAKAEASKAQAAAKAAPAPVAAKPVAEPVQVKAAASVKAQTIAAVTAKAPAEAMPEPVQVKAAAPVKVAPPAKVVKAAAVTKK